MDERLAIWSESFGCSSDPAVLLIMGAMNQSVFWPQPFYKRLADAGYYVVRYDHRDTGKSAAVDFQRHPYDLSALKNDALSVLEKHGISKASIVGLSMGGYIAQLLAIEHPQLVDRLVLISTSADHRPYMQATIGQQGACFDLPPPASVFLDYVRRSTEASRQLLSDIVEGWRVTYAGERPFPEQKIVEALQLSSRRETGMRSPFNHALAVLNSPDRLQQVKTIATPTQIIHGRYDPCLPLAHGEYLAQNIHGACIKVLGMGHSFQWSWDNEISDLILRFLEGMNNAKSTNNT